MGARLQHRREGFQGATAYQHNTLPVTRLTGEIRNANEAPPKSNRIKAPPLTYDLQETIPRVRNAIKEGYTRCDCTIPGRLRNFQTMRVGPRQTSAESICTADGSHLPFWCWVELCALDFSVIRLPVPETHVFPWPSVSGSFEV